MHLRSWFSMAAHPAALYPAEAQHAVPFTLAFHSFSPSFVLLLLFSFHCQFWTGEGGKEGAHLTENAGHDGDARVFRLPLGIVDAQRLEGGETDCLGAPGHFGQFLSFQRILNRKKEVERRLVKGWIWWFGDLLEMGPIWW